MIKCLLRAVKGLLCPTKYCQRGYLPTLLLLRSTDEGTSYRNRCKSHRKRGDPLETNLVPADTYPVCKNSSSALKSFKATRRKLRAERGVMEVLNGKQLKIAEALLLETFPQSLQVHGYIYRLNRVKAADPMDVLVDRWPDFRMILIRPLRQEKADFFKDVCIYCKDGDVLKQMLLETDTVSWQNYLCLGIDLCHQEVITEVAATKGITGNKVAVCHALKLEDPSHLPQIDCTSVTMSVLDETHIPLVNKTWKFGEGEHSVKFIKNMICNFPNCCILGAGGEPVAWVLTYAYCALGMLYTVPEHRGKGYAKMLISAIAQKLHAQGCPVFCFIEEENLLSFKLFRSLGFKEEPSYRAAWFTFNQFC